MSFVLRSTAFGAIVFASVTLVTAPGCAKPDDYTFELAAVGPDQSIVTIRLKLKVKGELVPNALIDCAAYVGPNGATTMATQGILQPGLKPGEYILIGEPGMPIFDLDLFAQVPGEAELVSGKIHVKNQDAQ
jgi:hypothetical protein